MTTPAATSRRWHLIWTLTPRCDHNDHMLSGADDTTSQPHVLLREAKFSELVARADLTGQVTVLTTHGRPAAAIDPAALVAEAPTAPAHVEQLWTYLDRGCPPAADQDLAAAREHHRRSVRRSP